MTFRRESRDQRDSSGDGDDRKIIHQLEIDSEVYADFLMMLEDDEYITKGVNVNSIVSDYMIACIQSYEHFKAGRKHAEKIKTKGR